MKLKGVTIDGVNYFVSEEQIKEHGSPENALQAVMDAKAAKEKGKKPQKETEK